MLAVYFPDMKIRDELNLAQISFRPEYNGNTEGTRR